MSFLSKLLGQKPAQERAPVKAAKDPITFLDFDDNQHLADYVAQYIQENRPSVVLISGPGAARYFPVSRLKDGVPADYEVLVNEECSVHWLTNTMKSLREKKGSHSIVISNFPTRFVDMVEVSAYSSQSGTSTIRIPGRDVLLPFSPYATKISMVIFWQGRAALSYLEAVYTYFLEGRKGIAELFNLWDLPRDLKLADAERERIRNTEHGEQRQALMRSMSREGDKYNWDGGVLR